MTYRKQPRFGAVFSLIIVMMLAAGSVAPLFAQDATPVVQTPTPPPKETPVVEDTAEVEPLPSTPTAEIDDALETPDIPSGTPEAGLGTSSRMTIQNSDMQPMAPIAGTTIYVQNTVPLNCVSGGWRFDLPIDPVADIFVTAHFSNGDFVSARFSKPPANETAIATISTHRQYQLVNAWVHLPALEPLALLTLTSGPCNTEIPPNGIYTATVRISTSDLGDSSGTTWTLVDATSQSVGSGVVDTTGEVTIPNLANGIYEFTIQDPMERYAEQSLTIIIQDQDISNSMRLHKIGGSTQFTVRTRYLNTTNPLEDATVWITSSDGAYEFFATSDDSGNADFGLVPHGRYTIEASKPGFYTVTSVFEVGTSIPSVLVLEMLQDTGIFMSGSVADRITQEPIVGATISIEGQEPTTSGESGDYLILTGGGSWTATFTAPGYHPMTMSANTYYDDDGNRSQVFDALLEPISPKPVNIQAGTSDNESAEGAEVLINGIHQGYVRSDGTFPLNPLTVGETYEVTVNGAPIGYTSVTQSLTVTVPVNTWNFTLEPAPIPTQLVNLNVTTSDGGSLSGTTYLVTLGTETVVSGAFDESGIVEVGNLPIGNVYSVAINGEAAGYETKTQNFTAAIAIPIWHISLDPLPPDEQAITLRVSTSDNGSPAGAGYTVVQGTTQLTSGILDASGEVSLGNLPIDGEYVVLITGLPAGYQDASQSFTVTEGVETWSLTLNPVPIPTQAITLNVSTSDSGSPAGATWSLMQGSITVDSGTLDATGEVSLGDLPIGGSYSVSVNGQPAGYQNANEPFTVTTGIGTWTLSLDPIPAQTQVVSLQVYAEDGGSIAGSTYTVTQGTTEIASGTLTALGTVNLGALPVGTSYSVAIDGTPAGYQSVSRTFEVIMHVNSWNISLNPIPTQAITLDVSTSDSGSPAGATYVVMQGSTEITSGTLDSSGDVPLGDLPIGETYSVAVNGQPTGYQDANEPFTVTEGVGTWSLTLDPIPAPVRTQHISLNVSTSDGSSPEGASFTVTEVTAAVSGLSTSPGPAVLMQVGPGPITGTLAADGSVDVGDLIVGSTYIVTISGSGFEDFSDSFMVEAGADTWSIELQALQVPVTPSPTVEPTPAPTETPAETATPTETVMTPTATPTEAVATPTTTIPATPTPTETDNQATPTSGNESESQVTGLPETGSGAGEINSRLLGVGALALVAILIALWNRKPEANR